MSNAFAVVLVDTLLFLKIHTGIENRRNLSALDVTIEHGLDVVGPDIVDGKEDGGPSHAGGEDAHHVVTAGGHGEGGGVDNIGHSCWKKYQ